MTRLFNLIIYPGTGTYNSFGQKQSITCRFLTVSMHVYVLRPRLTQTVVCQWIHSRRVWAWSRTTCTGDEQLRHTHSVCVLGVRGHHVSLACTAPSAWRHVRFWHQSGSNPKTCRTCKPRSIMFYWHHLKFVQSYQRETVPWLRVSVPILMDDNNVLAKRRI